MMSRFPPSMLTLFACLSLAGCSVTSTFQVVDATTNQPIEGVEVTRYEYSEQSFANEMMGRRGSRVWPWGLGPTDATGLLTSVTPWSCNSAENIYGFRFAKQGYQPAECRVEGGNAKVASPVSDVLIPSWRWSNQPERGHAVEATVSAGSTIRIPMSPSQPTGGR
jgi:hypothetical protein